MHELKAEPRVIEAIQNFRMGRVEVMPGGGGKYGEVRLAGAGGSGAGERGAKVALRLLAIMRHQLWKDLGLDIC